MQLPAVPGMEGAGTVEAAGSNVTHLAPGDRVGYCVAGTGSYAEYRLAKADRVIPLPDDIDFKQAAAMLLKGMTVEYLIHRTIRIRPGDHVLWHAAAGGIGLIACQWMKQLGATVIGTTGSKAKARQAQAHGCDHVILYNQEDVPARVRELTQGKGVRAAYDSVGADTFQAPWTHSHHAACSSHSAAHPAAYPPSTPDCSHRKDPSTSPAPP